MRVLSVIASHLGAKLDNEFIYELISFDDNGNLTNSSIVGLVADMFLELKIKKGFFLRSNCRIIKAVLLRYITKWLTLDLILC